MSNSTNIQFYPGDVVRSSVGTTGVFVKIESNTAHLETDRGFTLCFNKAGSPPELTLIERGLVGRIRDMTKDQFKAALVDLGTRIEQAQKRHNLRCQKLGITPAL